jgi:LysM repeat protein
VSPSASTAGATGQTSSYTVVAGDTLQTIAARFGTTAEAIAQLNSLPDPNSLTLGQKLQIPAAGSAAAAAGGAAAGDTRTAGQSASATSTYAVQAGDTLGKIAQRFGTTVAELQRLNKITNPDVLTLGQKLIVPGSSGGAAVAVPTGGQGRSYVVQRGDTLLSIARRFGLTVKQLQAANNISNPDRIAVGQKLIIP